MPLELDLDAPIVPGESAAGFRLHQRLGKSLDVEDAGFRRTPVRNHRGGPSGDFHYSSDAVDLWLTGEGVVIQIGVHGPYRGKLMDRVGLGMTIDDIERLVGPCAEDWQDNLSIIGIRGLAFDVAWRPGLFIAEDLDMQWPELRFSPVTDFVVYEEDQPNPWGSVTIARIPACE